MKKIVLTAVLLAMTAIPATAQMQSGQMMDQPQQAQPPYQMAPNQMVPMQSFPPWFMRGPGMGNYGMNRGVAPMFGYGYGPGGPGFGMGPMYNQGMMNPYASQQPNSGNYNLGPGVMMGQGMMKFGMGPGMIRGLGSMGYISSEKFQKFFDETRDLRKQMNGLMFDYAELLRKPDHNPADRVALENKIQALRQQVYEKAPRYQWPF